MVYAKDKRVLVTGGQDNIIKFWSIDTFKLVKVIVSH